MKRIILLMFLFFIFNNIFSQNFKERISVLLNSISDNQPADQLFLHTDRNLYQTGDTIRFQAFIRDYQTGVFETGSMSLHVLLLNSEHNTIDSARFRISYSTASGWLKVPDTAPLGEYSILAFTSGQMNYDPGHSFRITVGVDHIQPRASQIAPDSLNRNKDVDLRFLPEGGTFITGIKQRLAFNAVTSDGKSLKVSGEIVNLKGDIITEFRSGPYGPGVVEFTPVQGETYYAKPVETEFRNMSWSLPEPERSGVSVRVNNIRSGSIDIALSGNGTEGKEFFLTVTMNNILIFSKELKLDTLFNVRLKTEEIPAGTAFVTLYDNELNPVAERMIFLNAGKKMKVQIGISKSNTRPGSETELAINTTDEKGNNLSSIISVSAIDSSLGFHNSIPYPDIESIFLYDSEFYNNLPQSMRCRGLKNIDDKSVDQLMMTYGWRKYTLKESAMAFQQKRSDNYDHLKISNPGQEKRGREVIRLLTPEVGDVIKLSLNENREAVLPFDSLDAYARQIIVIPDDDPSRNSNPVTIEFPGNRAYTDSAKLIKTDSSYFEPEFVFAGNETSLFNPDSSIMIDAVTIKGNRKKPTEHVAKTAEAYKYSGAFTLYSEDFKFAQTFEDILYKLGAYKVDKKTKIVILRVEQLMPKVLLTSSDMRAPRTALFVLDDTPIFDRTYFPIAQLPASDIASVTVIRGPQGFARYGTDARFGMILVTTKTGNRINGIIDPNDKPDPIDNNLKQVRIFRSEVEYYIPTKEQVEVVPEYQFRPTLLWKSDVYLDGSGPIKFKYPNNIGTGTVMVFVNGVSLTNLVGSGRKSYLLQ
jgi:hypothetical protein